MKYEAVTAAHLAAWGMEPEGVDTFVGISRIEDDGAVTAIGGVWLIEGRWIALLEERSPVRHGAVHRLALRLFARLEAHGIDEVWAELDDSVPRARAWMQRLGFVPTDGSWWRRASNDPQNGRAGSESGDGGEGCERGRDDRGSGQDSGGGIRSAKGRAESVQSGAS